MTTIQSQTFSFLPSQPGVQQVTIASIVSSVPLDGSASVLVPFLQPFAQICESVNVQFTPVVETDYQISTQVLNATVNGFTLIATGGPTGTTGQFTYQATGV